MILLLFSALIQHNLIFLASNYNYQYPYGTYGSSGYNQNPGYGSSLYNTGQYGGTYGTNPYGSQGGQYGTLGGQYGTLGSQYGYYNQGNEI